MDDSALFFSCSPNKFGVLSHVSSGFGYHILYTLRHKKLCVLLIVIRFMKLHMVCIIVKIELVYWKIIYDTLPKTIINKYTQVALF